MGKGTWKPKPVVKPPGTGTKPKTPKKPYNPGTL